MSNNSSIGGMYMLRKNSDCHNLIMDQIKDVEDCLFKFKAFMRACTGQEASAQSLEKLCQAVQDAEAAADITLRSLIDATGNGAYLPSTREDLIDIANSCDKIANKCEYVSYLIMLYRFRFPEGYTEDINQIFDITEQQFVLLETSIGMLFSRMNTLQKDPLILDEIRKLESMVDQLESKIGHRIFAMDADLAFKMQFFGLVEKLCDISDLIEDIADRIQIMLIARKA